MALHLKILNPQQREAVIHGNGPLLVLAGAGSGKTRTMAYRMAHLLTDRNVPAYQILGLSFTNKAALELRDRVRSLVKRTAGVGLAKGLTVSTFHSLCVRLLRKHADRLGYRTDFTILDSSDQLDVLRQILRRVRIDDRKFDPKSILFRIGQTKNRFLLPEEASHILLQESDDPFTEAVAVSYLPYMEELRALNAMDFDDLLFNGVRLLGQCPDLRDHYSQTYRHILVDEYQDTNGTQFKLLRLLTHTHSNLCVVGDDDQSIYAWRGADPSHILGFGQHFPDAKTIILDRNYRSTETILKAANEVIALNPKRHPKRLWSNKGDGEPIREIVTEDDRDEAETVAEEVQFLVKPPASAGAVEPRSWDDIAVLYRSNTQSRLFEEAFRSRQIPYRIVGGMSFLERKEIKDVLAYWRLILNPSDDASARRICNWPARGLGKGSLEKLNQAAFDANQSLYETLPDAEKIAPRGAKGALALHGALTRAREQLEKTRARPEELSFWALQTLDAFQIKKGIDEDCSDNPAQAEVRWDNARELTNALGQSVEKDLQNPLKEDPWTAPELLREFLSRLVLEGKEEDSDNEDKQKSGVTFLTLHGSKGLEFPVVFLVGLEDGFLPHRRVMEEGEDLGEERRLCYVGITRAQEQLVLTRARTRLRYGKKVPRNRSRFLEAIPEDLLLKEDRSADPELKTTQQQEEHENKVRNFLQQIRAGLE